MHIVFFGARLPLTKTIVYRDNGYTVAPYPHVSRLTSFHTKASSLQDFHDLLTAHAGQDHCLFNGQLKQPLVDESRAGKTLKDTAREWIVFDFDKVDAKSHSEVVSKYLPPECQNVSYIVQHSAGMFRPDASAFSGHIFMLLKQPSKELQLRQWIEYLNFTIPALKDQIDLTDSGMGLHWPLDRSAAYDSKLIYVAPPKCIGFQPAIKQEKAILLVKKKNSHLAIPSFVPLARQQIEAEINQRRQACGMTAHDFRTRAFEDGEVLIGAEPAAISDIKPMGEHYIKFNMNGGDSMAYWIDLRNPSVIKNFKGEPWLLTKEVDEKFYKTLVKTAPGIVSKKPIDDGTEVLAFYTTNQSSTIKIGTYAPCERRLTLNTSNETAARSWLAEFGIIGGRLPHMDLIFDPTNDIQYVPGATHINTFRATEYMIRAKTKTTPSTLSDIPPITDKTLRSVLGNPVDTVYRHFINWLAFVFQFREKTQTAWVLSGRTGTGKGTFVRHILTPLFGSDAVRVEQFGAIMQQFNGYLEKALFVIFEEADTRSIPNQSELMAKLRHYITDSPISIRRMQTDHYTAPNYTNFIFNANERTSVIVPHDDRRFNFAERQEDKIVYTPNEILALQAHKEIDAFADVLQRWPVDKVAVTQIIQTKAQADVHEATTPINQLVAEAIVKGDLQFFLERMPSDAEAAGDFFNRFNPIGLFKAQMDRYLACAHAGEKVLLKDEDLFTIFRTMIPNTQYFQDSKTWRRRHYKTLGLEIDKRVRVPGKWDQYDRGVLVQWQIPEGSKMPDASERVTDIKKGRKRA